MVETMMQPIEEQKSTPNYADNWARDAASAATVFELNSEEKNAPEYRRFLSEQQEFNTGKRSKPPRDWTTEDKIDQALAHTPFQIQAESTDEKKALYTYLHVLMNSDVGKAWMAEAQKVADSKGKITLKTEEQEDTLAFVSANNPRTICLNSKTIKDLEKNTPNVGETEELAYQKYQMTGTVGHEMQHVFQKCRQGDMAFSSLENAAKWDVMCEMAGRMANIAFATEKGVMLSDSDFFSWLKAQNKEKGLDETAADKEARTSLAFLFLTNCRNMKGTNDLKERINEWNTGYKKQALNIATTRKIINSTDTVARENDMMNWLCDSMGVDKDLCAALLATYFADNRRTPSVSGIQEVLKNDGTFISRGTINGHSVVMKSEGTDKDSMTTTYINGSIHSVEMKDSDHISRYAYKNGKLSEADTVYTDGYTAHTVYDGAGKNQESVYKSPSGVETTTKYADGAKIYETVKSPDGSIKETSFGDFGEPNFVIESRPNGWSKRTDFEYGQKASSYEITPHGDRIEKKYDAEGREITLPPPTQQAVAAPVLPSVQKASVSTPAPTPATSRVSAPILPGQAGPLPPKPEQARVASPILPRASQETVRPTPPASKTVLNLAARKKADSR